MFHLDEQEELFSTAHRIQLLLTILEDPEVEGGAGLG